MTKNLGPDDGKLEELQRLYATGTYSQEALAELFGCSQPTVSRRLKRTKNVSPDVDVSGGYTANE